jgi:hypothetical protein
MAAGAPIDRAPPRRRVELFSVANLGPHATFLATEFPPTFTRFLRAHTQLRQMKSNR